VRLIQHKKEAYWFYRFLTLGYDRWVNPLFWTRDMRTAALELARLENPRLTILDAGAGTGFTTEGIVEYVEASCVTMLDQSPHQLAHAARKPLLARCRRVRGDAEALPFATDSFDRYVSAGSIEYWPDPQRALAEAYRVVKPGGIALVVGPLPPANRAARLLAASGCCFRARTSTGRGLPRQASPTSRPRMWRPPGIAAPARNTGWRSRGSSRPRAALRSSSRSRTRPSTRR